jgi:outer membrane biosynthesis protein TonB
MDGLMTAVLGIASIAAFADDSSGAGLALGATSGLFLASALRGNTAANQCSAAHAEYTAMRQRAPIDVQDPPPRMVIRRQTKPKPKPVQPVEPALEPDQPAPPVDEPPPEVAPPYAAPRPPNVKPADSPKPTKKPPEPTDEDWGAFWKETP